jgi:hypothetical protein
VNELKALGTAALVAGGVAYFSNAQPPVICCAFIATYMISGYLFLRYRR